MRDGSKRGLHRREEASLGAPRLDRLALILNLSQELQLPSLTCNFTLHSLDPVVDSGELFVAHIDLLAKTIDLFACLSNHMLRVLHILRLKFRRRCEVSVWWVEEKRVRKLLTSIPCTAPPWTGPGPGLGTGIGPGDAA